MAECILQVKSVCFSSTSRFGNDNVRNLDFFPVETGTERLHAYSHPRGRSGFNPADEVVVGESNATICWIVGGAVLGCHEDGGNGEVGVVLGKANVLAHGWHRISKSIELSRERKISDFGDVWGKGILDHEPVKMDALVKTIEVLELSCAEA